VGEIGERNMEDMIKWENKNERGNFLLDVIENALPGKALWERGAGWNSSKKKGRPSKGSEKEVGNTLKKKGENIGDFRIEIGSVS